MSAQTGAAFLLKITDGSTPPNFQTVAGLRTTQMSVAGELRLHEMAALFWHCLVEREELAREKVGEALMHCGIAEASKRLRTILTQILQGAG